jgi:hypothetical protein
MMEDQNRQSRFAAICAQYLGQFKEDPPLASMTVDETIAAMERALICGEPLTDDRVKRSRGQD